MLHLSYRWSLLINGIAVAASAVYATCVHHSLCISAFKIVNFSNHALKLTQPSHTYTTHAHTYTRPPAIQCLHIIHTVDQSTQKCPGTLEKAQISRLECHFLLLLRNILLCMSRNLRYIYSLITCLVIARATCNLFQKGDQFGTWDACCHDYRLFHNLVLCLLSGCVCF